MKVISQLSILGLVILGGFFVWSVRVSYQQDRAFLATCKTSGGDHVERKHYGPRECWNTGNGRRIFPDKEITP